MFKDQKEQNNYEFSIENLKKNGNLSESQTYYPFLQFPSTFYNTFPSGYSELPTFYFPPPFFPSFDSHNYTNLSTKIGQQRKFKESCGDTKIKIQAQKQINVIKIETDQGNSPIIETFTKPKQEKIYQRIKFQHKFPPIQVAQKLFPKFTKLIQMHINQIEDSQIYDNFIQTQFDAKMRQNQLFKQIIRSFTEKFNSYRKTKEQLIKYIIRRTYNKLRTSYSQWEKPDIDRLMVFHEKNLSSFKSMNIQFLRREFGNPFFVEVFKDFIRNLDQFLQKENQEKTTKFAIILMTCFEQGNVKLLHNERRIPWTYSYKKRIKGICIQLLRQHEGSIFKEQSQYILK